MQFHKTATMWDRQKSLVSPAIRDFAAFYDMKIKLSEKKGLGGDILNNLLSEFLWIEGRRPYYKVYPCISEALCRLRLDAKFQCPDVPQKQISIRFALGNEPKTKDGIKIGSLFVHNVTLRTPSGKESTGMTIFADILNPPSPNFEIFFMTFDPNPRHYQSVEELLDRGQDPNSSLRNENEKAIRKELQALSIRIALTVCMLAKDSEIITPDVLADQQNRYDAEKDENWKKKAELRAKNRGVLGWSIGKNIEVSPHFRRPHFALRYTGPNGSIPQIVPVKFCTVNMKKLTKVPTGHMLEDGTEVEQPAGN